VDVDTEPANLPAYASARSLIDERERLWRATHGLRKIAPHLSAHDGLTRRQHRVIGAALAVMLLAFVFDRRHTGIAVVAAMTVVYTAVIGLRLLLIVKSLDKESDHDSATLTHLIPDDELPVVTVLVPMYKEPEVLGALVTALGNLDYAA
jgi:hypothetical protein